MFSFGELPANRTQHGDQRPPVGTQYSSAFASSDMVAIVLAATRSSPGSERVFHVSRTLLTKSSRGFAKS